MMGELRRCILCGFEAELDDSVVETGDHERTICLRCYARETGAEVRMTARLRRDVEQSVRQAMGG